MYKWTEEKINILRDIYPNGNIEQLLKVFYPAKIDSIRHKASDLGIKVIGDYTEDDILFIKENYEKMTYSEIGDILGRTSSAIGIKIMNLGLVKSRKWSNEEIEIVKTIYPEYGAKYTMENYLPYRKECSIINIATKNRIFRINKDEKYYNHEDLIIWLKDLADEIGRTPKTKELTKYFLPHPKTYERYFGSYANACELAGLIPNSNLFGKPIICYSKNGDRCLSESELKITNFFIDTKILYHKEIQYFDYMPKEECGNRRTDWVIGNNVFVEYFGMSDKEHYYARMIEKRELCRKYNIELIELFRNDLKNLHRIFQGFITN